MQTGNKKKSKLISLFFFLIFHNESFVSCVTFTNRIDLFQIGINLEPGRKLKEKGTRKTKTKQKLTYEKKSKEKNKEIRAR